MGKTEARRREAAAVDEHAHPARTAITAAAAAAALKQASRRARDMSRQAADLSRQARRRAGGEITRRRKVAADGLESLAAAMRPLDPARRRRRRTIAVAGGSTLAIAAALGIGVALGMYLSRRLKKTSQAQTEGAETTTPSAPIGLGEPTDIDMPEHRGPIPAG